MWRSRSPASLLAAAGTAGPPARCAVASQSAFLGLQACHGHKRVHGCMGRCLGLGRAAPANRFLHIQALLLGTHQGEVLAIEHISDEFCCSSASKNGDTLQHAAFVFTRGLRRLGTSSCF